MVSCKRHTEYEGECLDCKRAYAEYKERQRGGTEKALKKDGFDPVGVSVDERIFFGLVHTSTCGLLEGVSPSKFKSNYDDLFPIVWDAARAKREKHLGVE